jgi:hypothetical protein
MHVRVVHRHLITTPHDGDQAEINQLSQFVCKKSPHHHRKKFAESDEACAIEVELARPDVMARHVESESGLWTIIAFPTTGRFDDALLSLCSVRF